MGADLDVIAHQLILGGQRSGKSRQAERMARAWLDAPGSVDMAAGSRCVRVLATAWPGDEDMQDRIQRHRRDRDPRFDAIDVGADLGEALRRASAPEALVVIDCLTLWVTQVLMPPAEAHAGESGAARASWPTLREGFLRALREATGPVVLVSNEIGWGVVPMGREVREVVDELGRLHQDVAKCCSQITLMVAGQPFTRDVQGAPE